MLKLLSFIVFTFLTICSKAQGSWDIGYIHVDSLNKKHIGHVIRIDFKSSNPWTNSEGQRGIRSYVAMKDTGVIAIDTSSVVLVERRKIYVDHGSYGDQYLECINCKKESVYLFDCKILSVDPDFIEFQIDIEARDGDNVKRREVKVVRIDKSKLDGVMFKRQ